MSKREYTYKGGKRPSMRKKGELAMLKSQYKQSQKELRKQEQSLIKKINTLCDEIEAAMNVFGLGEVAEPKAK